MLLKDLVKMALVLIFFVPGVNGISVGLSGSEADSGFSDTLTIDANKEDSVNVFSVMKGPALEQYASGSGNLHKIFGASNHNGERALITADVVNAGHWEYYQPFIYTDAISASVTGFGLTATGSDSIKCAASATNRRGDRVGAGVEVSQGSLNNYWANAIASSSGVGVLQSFREANGGGVSVTERAANSAGFLSTTTNVEDGSIIGYRTDPLVFSGKGMMDTRSLFESAMGRKISSESSAYRTCGYRSNAKMNIEGTQSLKGQAIGFSSSTSAGFDFETNAQQHMVKGTQGNMIELSGSSMNNERDISSTSMQIRSTDTTSGFVDGYWGITESYQDGVVVLNPINSAGGDSIQLKASASNKKNDRANANIYAYGDGYIANYVGFSRATALTATATNRLHAVTDRPLAGQEIGIDTSASNAAGYNALISTVIQEGHIMGSISNEAKVDSSAKELIAYQNASEVFGSMMAIDIFLRDAVNGGKKYNFSFPNPSGLYYSVDIMLPP